MSSFDSNPNSFTSHPLLEREQHIDDLHLYLASANVGQGSMVFIDGNAGIGKTALVREFIRQVTRHARVLAGACDPLSTKEPLAPLFDIVAAAGTDAHERMRSAETRMSRFRTLLDLMSGGRRPCLLVFEDVHWADEATLDLLRFIGRRIRTTRAMLIATYRNDEVGNDHSLRIVLGDIAGFGASHRMSLPPLSEDAIGILADGRDIDPEELHRLTGGNPFFVTEILSTDQEGIPETVRDAVLARASRLSTTGREVINAAAIIGSPGDMRLLHSVLEAGQNGIDECVQAGILAVSGEVYSFRHEIARQSILESIAPQRRGVLHRRALHGLEQLPAGPERLAKLAYHAEAAGEREAVLRYAPNAARQASDLNAHRESTAQFERALRFAGDLGQREHARMIEYYAQECLLTDRIDDAIQARRDALDLWRKVGEPYREAENLYWMARALVLAGKNAEADAASQAAVDILEAREPSPELASAYQIQAHLRMLNRDNGEAIKRGMQAIRLAESLDANEALIYAYNTIGSAMMLSGKNMGRRYLERSAKMAGEAGRDDYVASAYVNLGAASGEIYEFEQADRYLTEGIDYCVERDFDFDRNYMLAWQALSHFFQGRWTEAAKIASALLRYPKISAITRIMSQVALGRVRTRRGDPEAGTVLDAALANATRTATLQRLGPVRAARAEAAWLAGNIKKTRDEARSTFDLAIRQGHPWFIGELAYWRWKAEDIERAPDGAAKPYALQIAGKFEAAADCWDSLNCPYEAARALADADDVPAMRRALDRFDALGATPARANLAQRLHDFGASSVPRGAHPSTRANPARLTRRQIDVAELVADGCTNAQIADRLYISPKTVENHITALFAKLQVGNRAEAARELARLGITPTK